MVRLNLIIMDKSNLLFETKLIHLYAFLAHILSAQETKTHFKSWATVPQYPSISQDLWEKRYVGMILKVVGLIHMLSSTLVFVYLYEGLKNIDPQGFLVLPIYCIYIYIYYPRPDRYLQHQWIFFSDTLHMYLL